MQGVKSGCVQESALIVLWLWSHKHIVLALCLDREQKQTILDRWRERRESRRREERRRGKRGEEREEKEREEERGKGERGEGEKRERERLHKARLYGAHKQLSGNSAYLSSNQVSKRKGSVGGGGKDVGPQ